MTMMPKRGRGRSLGPALALILLSAAAAPALAQEPITHEAMWQMKRLAAPELSPDGRWAVIAVTEPAYDSQQQATNLWLAAVDGSEAPRRITAARSAESGIAWSPDSRRIAFAARRDGDDAPQLYVLDLAAGGEAVRVTTLSTGASAPKWSPDGRSLLFSSSVYAGVVGDSAARAVAAARRGERHRARVYDTFPIRDFDRWLDDRQPRLFTLPLTTSPTPAAAGAPVDLLGASTLAREPGFAGRGDLHATWTPDGTGVVFVATTTATAAAYAAVPHQLYWVGAQGGEPVALTAGADSYGAPAFDSDGRRLYALVTPGTGMVYNLTRLAAFDWPAQQVRDAARASATSAPGLLSTPTVLTAAWDRSVSSYRLAPDARTIYLVAEEEARDRIFTLPATAAAGTQPRVLTAGSAGVYGGLAVGGTARAPVLVAIWESAAQPPELVRLDARTGSHRALSSFNMAAAARLDLPPLREFSFTASNGRRIQNYIALPPGFDESARYPLLVLMHGGPHSAWKDQFVIRWNYHLLARPGYVVLLTNYTGSTGFGEAFAQAIQGDPLAGPAQEINEAADEAIRRFPFIDATRQAAAGASYGGHLAYWMQGVTDRYRTLVAHAGAINMEAQWGTSDVIYHREVNFGGPVWEQGPLWREQNPIRLAANFRTPMLLTVGERDFRVPLNTTLEAWSVLQRLQIPSRLIVFPDENHWILDGENSRFFYRELHAWLARFLGPSASAADGS
jgi:dipeptidyl aminopeptidase/acylaminoacyl peptidase